MPTFLVVVQKSHTVRQNPKNWQSKVVVVAITPESAELQAVLHRGGVGAVSCTEITEGKPLTVTA